MRSPVDTGSFRASWRVAFNTVDKSITDGGASGTPLPPPEFYWPVGFHPGDMVYISNSQPYAVKLEYGWSKQAPMGIARVTAASMKAFAQ